MASKKEEPKKLCLAEDDKKICGVCGGFAKYLDLDSTLVRILWIIITLFYGSGLLLYIICALIMPKEAETKK